MILILLVVLGLAPFDVLGLHFHPSRGLPRVFSSFRNIKKACRPAPAFSCSLFSPFIVIASNFIQNYLFGCCFAFFAGYLTMRNASVDSRQEVHFCGLYVTSVSLLKDSQIAPTEQGKYSRSCTNLGWNFFWWMVLM
jgi:hypothetical protein